MEQSHRPIRLLLNAQLIRRVDETVASGSGGFTSREEFVEEALNSYLLELRDVEYLPGEQTREKHMSIVPPEPFRRAVSERAHKISMRISMPSPGFSGDGDAMFLEESPMLGLHNRDWPSFWALSRLAHAASEGPVPFPSFLNTVTEEAWQLAAYLKEELGVNAKAATQMLPTNVLKKQAADAGFQNFAIGSLSNRPLEQGLHKVAGPLPTWGAIAFFKDEREFKVSLTKRGWKLLEIVEGLGAEQPHDHQVAEAFFGYLRSYAPSDWWGFKNVLNEVSKGPTRDALLAAIGTARDWSPSVASSAAQGYIARCREWGLIEPKLLGGTYQLTKFGKDTLQSV